MVGRTHKERLRTEDDVMETLHALEHNYEMMMQNIIQSPSVTSEQQITKTQPLLSPHKTSSMTMTSETRTQMG